MIGLGIGVQTDIAFGIFIIHAMGKTFGFDPPIYFYPIGGFLSLLPDIDYLYALWQKWRGEKKADETHRRLPHYPIVMVILICSILGILFIFWSIFGYWAVVAALCLLSHYVHDSIEGEWGLRWLAPRGKKFYKLFSKKEGKRRFVCSFTPEELRSKPLMDDMEWLETYYLRPTKRSVTGALLFIGAVLIATFW